MTTRDGWNSRANVALALLILINLFNYIDRQILAAVESRIEKTFFSEEEYPYVPGTKTRVDSTIEAKMGLLNTAFMLTYILIAPVFGLLADRVPRWLLVGIGVIAWSLATGATGLAGTFTILLLTRCLVGVGEAAYGPAAPTMIADLFPVENRGRMMAMFYMAIPVGSALGYVLGGQVTAWAGGVGEAWRWAFYVVVPPGILLGIWCFLMRDPPRAKVSGQGGARNASWRDYLHILKTPSYTINTAGMTAMTFALGGMAFWMPRYAERRGAGELDEVNVLFGIIVVVSGLTGTIVGGILGDLLKPRIKGAYFVVSAAAMALAFPFILCVLWTPFPAAWVFVFFACFCLFFNTGPTNTILANVTHPATRASAFALNILIIHALGDAISPTLIGLINGVSGDMNMGFLAVSFLCLVGAGLWLIGAKYVDRDTEAISALGEPSKDPIQTEPFPVPPGSPQT
ncbi:MAG: MFS transporter [Planctomycetes bacterium]|nr:MFS transporter [Planctomycetota bacterium]